MSEEIKKPVVTEGIKSGLEDADISENVKQGFLDYAMSVIVARALPDVKDGFKPVHRRIVYAMNESGYTSDRPHVKCAKIVGDVMGNYHPHGDSSIYDALVRLAQNFSMRYTLIDGHGNFGNLDGDQAAAMRYTEARLGKLAQYLVKDIKENTVDFIDNYDGSAKEPVSLPCRFPNLIVNGSSGIAVGMATYIPPHNITETINAVVAVAKNPEIEVLDLMENYISGPDFPTGGYILGRSGIRKVYETGKGGILCRGKAEIVTKGNKNEIIISEIPYDVRKSALVEKIGELADDKIITGITRVNDESSDKNGVRIVIELSKEAYPEVVLNNLYKQTQLQTKISAQMISIVNGAPKLLNLKEMISEYLSYQREIIARRTQFRLDKAMARDHILEGLILASDNIDEVIKIIKESETTKDAGLRLREIYNLSEIQSDAILAITLGKLAHMEKVNLAKEKEELAIAMARYRAILSSEEEINEMVINELEEVKAKLADERKTTILEGEDDVEDEDLIEKQDIIITLTETGYIKRMKSDTFKVQNRGGMGVIGMKTHEDDDVKLIVSAHSHSDILFFTNLGKVYRCRGHRIPSSDRTGKGIPANHLINLADNEKILSIIKVDQYDAETNIFCASKYGIVKKTNISEYERINQAGKIALGLKDGDELIDVKITDKNTLICIAANNSKMVKFKETDVRNMGRTATGVKGINLDGGYEALSLATSNEGDYVLVITENGYGKMSKIEEYRQTSRGSKGVITLKASEKRGSLKDMKIVNGDEDIVVVTKNGTIVRTSLEQINITSRNTQGIKIVNIKDGDSVSSITIVKPNKEEEVEETNESNED